jgi:methylenetetrahydrofolate dehydrogenase (NADP+)/methenyltetrahydrofolate cyclohydrolase
MVAQLIDGAKIAAQIREQLEFRVSGLKINGITPGLAVILVGNDPASESYVKAKGREAERWNILPPNQSARDGLRGRTDTPGGLS